MIFVLCLLYLCIGVYVYYSREGVLELCALLFAALLYSLCSPVRSSRGSRSPPAIMGVKLATSGGPPKPPVGRWVGGFGGFRIIRARNKT